MLYYQSVLFYNNIFAGYEEKKIEDTKVVTRDRSKTDETFLHDNKY